jgi:predicted secreted protein
MSEQEPQTARLKVGEQIEIRLKGLGSAGYVWGYTIEGSQSTEGGQGRGNVVSVKEVAFEPTSRREREDADSPPKPPSVHSVDQLFIIEGHKPGSATVRFAQRRPWEKESQPLKEHIVQVGVEDSIASTSDTASAN